jgi:hypothetical protein
MPGPQRIAVLSQPLLANRYGAPAASVTAALEKLPGTQVVVSGRSDAAGIRRDLQATLRGAPDAAVLLIGGAATMPFFEIPLVPRLDDDTLVPTDNPYGVAGAGTVATEVALPERPVGRIPDHPDDTAASFAERIAALCRPARAAPGAVYLLSAKVWEETSRSMAARLEPEPKVDLAPPRAPADFESPKFVDADARRFLFNLHGSDRDPRWFGQDGNRYPPALDPGAVASLGAARRLAGALVLSQACYGAFLLMPGGLRRVGQACCLRFLERGAAGFVGSTTIAYGGATGQLVCSDVLAVEFLRAASAGAPLGAALQRARQILASAVRSPPAGSELKTLLQFVLYGDPLCAWARVAPTPKSASAAEGAPGAGEQAEIRERLAEYTRWSEQEVPVRKRARAGGAAWNEVARFAATGARREAKGPPGRGGGPAQRRVQQRVASVEDAPGAELACFRESVRYADGTEFEARSTGGRATLSIEEELAGAAPWWNHAGAVLAAKAVPQVVSKGKAAPGHPAPARPKGRATRRPARPADAPNGKPRRAGKTIERGAT